MKAKIVTAFSVGALTLLGALANVSQVSFCSRAEPRASTACPDDDKKPKVACPGDKKPAPVCPDDDKKPKAQPASLA